MTFELSPSRELVEITLALAAVTVAGWASPLGYDTMGHIYLLVVILLSLRVSRGSALVAAAAGALVWNFTFVPPRLEFSKIGLNDGLLLGIYFLVALTAAQLTTHIRLQQREERRREQRATALFHLSRALAGARSLDEGVTAALRQVDEVFEAKSVLLLADQDGELTPHPAGSLRLTTPALGLTNWAVRHRRDAGRFTAAKPETPALHLPLLRDDRVLGALVVQPPERTILSLPQHRSLLDAFGAQVALLIEREHLRSAGERARLLAESDRLHRTLLDSVSHELRTPLAVLQAAAESLARDGAARHPALPAEILTATQRLNRMVANLLSQSRLEAGGICPRLDWCDVRDLIAAARRGLGEAIAGRPLRLEIPADLPLLHADAPLMEQVFTNLLLNAVLYSPAGTPLTIIAGVDDERGVVQVTLADEGPGIPPELRAQLYRKFQRGATTGGTGLGLGLSIVRGFMQAQGGEVTIEDHAGPGARITLSLPRAAHACVPME